MNRKEAACQVEFDRLLAREIEIRKDMGRRGVTFSADDNLPHDALYRREGDWKRS